MFRFSPFSVMKALRPKQWSKNLLLFAGIVFSHNLGNTQRLSASILAFGIFCLLSGVIYIINDIRDADSDRNHPLKCQRPIASGALPIPAAWLIALVLCFCAFVGAFSINKQFGLIAAAYFVLMVCYSFWLKHVVILDLMVVALGFVIRAIAGVLAIERTGEYLPITPWFITCVLFLALFIAICKRRHEILLLSGTARKHRPVLEHYSTDFLDQMVSVATAATVISYALYVTLGVTKSPQADYMIYTLPFVLYGVFRYLFLVYKRDEGGSPEVLVLQDAPLLINVALWLITVTLIFYR